MVDKLVLISNCWGTLHTRLQSYHLLPQLTNNNMENAKKSEEDFTVTITIENKEEKVKDTCSNVNPAYTDTEVKIGGKKYRI